MYEAKYSKYITKNKNRFAEAEEIAAKAAPFSVDGKACGVPLLYKDDTLYVDNSDSHTMVIGPTGCKKTRTTVFATVSAIIDAGESAIINDPKGEIYARTAEHARAKGHTVYVLNFRDTSCSDCWNPLRLAYKFHKEGNEIKAVECINDLVVSIVSPALEKTVDRYWADTSRALLNGLTMMLMDSVPKEYFNLKNLVQLSIQDNADELRRVLNRMDQNSVAAFNLHTVLDLSAEKTLSCVFSSLLSMLGPFVQNEGLMKLLCENTIDIDKINTKPTAVYIIYPDEKETLNFLVNAFLTQTYETFVNSSYKTDNGYEARKKKKVRVNYILDEFSNLPKINLFENRISEARSRNIRYFLFIQSFSQLENKYKENAETIISNCNNWLCFSSREMEFLGKISGICGTVVDYNGVVHDLISPTEMQHLEKRMDSADVLILKEGMYPFVSKLPDIDMLKEFSGYPTAELANVKTRSTAKYFSFDTWYRKVSNGTFSVPYAKNSRSKTIEAELEEILLEDAAAFVDD